MVSEFIEEHGRSRVIAKAMADALRANDGQAIMENAEGYFNLVSQHIRKENMLFPTWIKPLPEDERKEIGRKFEDIEVESIGLGMSRAYLQSLERVGKEL